MDPSFFLAPGRDRIFQIEDQGVSTRSGRLLHLVRPIARNKQKRTQPHLTVSPRNVSPAITKGIIHPLYPRLAVSTARYSHERFASSTVQELRSQWATNRRKDAESTFVSGYMSAKRRVKRGNSVASTISRFAVTNSCTTHRDRQLKPSPSAAEFLIDSELPKVIDERMRCKCGNRACSTASRVPEPGSRSNHCASLNCLAVIFLRLAVLASGCSGAATMTRSSSNQGITIMSDAWHGPSMNPRSAAKSRTAVTTSRVLPIRNCTREIGISCRKRASIRGRT